LKGLGFNRAAHSAKSMGLKPGIFIGYLAARLKRLRKNTEADVRHSEF